MSGTPAASTTSSRSTERSNRPPALATALLEANPAVTHYERPDPSRKRRAGTFNLLALSRSIAEAMTGTERPSFLPLTSDDIAHLNKAAEALGVSPAKLESFIDHIGTIVSNASLKASFED